MSLASLMVMDVQVVHPGSRTNRYNNDEFDWITATYDESKAWISQRNATEEKGTSRVDGQSSEWVIYLPTTTALDAGDRIIWEGNLFDVVGLPNPAHTPRGLHHREATLRLVEG